MRLFILFLFCVCFSPMLKGTEIFDSLLEEHNLKNIHQITFASMGFEKAGEAYFSADGENIVFQAVPFGKEHYQIYIMNLKNGVPLMISTGKGACTCAYFRPDGKKVIFASSHEDPELDYPNYTSETPGYKRSGDYSWEFTKYMNIYEANLDGSQLKPLTEGPNYHAECAYSPDGSKIVFCCNKDHSMNIYTMDADGTNVQQVTHTDSCYNGGPFFSPDGKRIIFRADRQKRHFLQIYTIGIDGSDETQLTDNQFVNWAPYWHSNGKVFAYTTSIHGHKHYEIYAMNVLTGATCRITHNESFDGLPVFSLDGQKMMWTSKRGMDNTCQLFIADFCMPNELL